jgi:hypothetical protein
MQGKCDCFVGFEILTVVLMNNSVFWDITLCSLLKISCFRGTFLLHLQGQRRALLASYFMLLSCLAYSLTLMMEEKRSPERFVDFQWTTWHYIPEGRTLQNVIILIYISLLNQNMFTGCSCINHIQIKM